MSKRILAVLMILLALISSACVEEDEISEINNVVPPILKSLVEPACFRISTEVYPGIPGVSSDCQEILREYLAKSLKWPQDKDTGYTIAWNLHEVVAKDLETLDNWDDGEQTRMTVVILLDYNSRIAP